MLRETTHGASKTAEYRAWGAMKERCHVSTAQEFQNYGARGISVCPQWRESFETFLRDVGPRPTPSHSLDRIENDGDYAPGNVRWATPLQQSLNRRVVTRYQHHGAALTIRQWAETIGIGYETLRHRLKRLHWPLDKALGTPLYRHTAPPDDDASLFT